MSAKEIRGDSHAAEENLPPPLRALETYLSLGGPEELAAQFGLRRSPEEMAFFGLFLLTLAGAVERAPNLSALLAFYLFFPLWAGSLFTESRRIWALAAEVEGGEDRWRMGWGSASFSVFTFLFPMYLANLLTHYFHPLAFPLVLVLLVPGWWHTLATKLLPPDLGQTSAFFSSPEPKLLSSEEAPRSWKALVKDLAKLATKGVLVLVTALFLWAAPLNYLDGLLDITFFSSSPFLAAWVLAPIFQLVLRPFLVSRNLRFLAAWSAREKLAAARPSSTTPAEVALAGLETTRTLTVKAAGAGLLIVGGALAALGAFMMAMTSLGYALLEVWSPAPIPSTLLPPLVACLTLGALLGMVLVPTWTLRRLRRWDQRRDGLTSAHGKLVLRKLLEYPGWDLQSLLDPEEEVQAVWTDWSDLPWEGLPEIFSTFLFPLFGIVFLAALQIAEGRPAIWVANSFFLLLPVAIFFFGTLASRMPLPVFTFHFLTTVGTAVCSVAVGYTISPIYFSGPLLAFLGLVFLACLGIYSRRVRQALRQAPSLLIQTNQGWRKVDLPLASVAKISALDRGILRLLGDQLATEPVVRRLLPSAPLVATRLPTALRVEFPLEGGETTRFAFELGADAERLVTAASPTWKEALAAPETSPRPLLPTGVLGAHLVGAAMAAYLIMYGLDLGQGLVPFLVPATDGRPQPLLEASRRLDRRYPLLAVPASTRVLAALELGFVEEAVEAGEKVRVLSGGRGVAADLAKQLVGSPEFPAFLEGYRELQTRTSSLPEGERELARAQGYEALLFDHPISSTTPLLAPLRLAREAFQSEARKDPEARLFLAELLGQIRWPVDLSIGRAVPEGGRETWAQEALQLLESETVAAPLRACLRGRILFRQGDYPAAAENLAECQDPGDQLMRASALRNLPGQLPTARELVETLRPHPAFQELDGDLLSALIAQQQGVLDETQPTSTGEQGSGDEGRRFRSLAIRELLQALRHGPPPREPEPVPSIAAGENSEPDRSPLLSGKSSSKPKQAQESRKAWSRRASLSWRPWMQLEDLILLHGIRPAPWSLLTTGAPFRGEAQAVYRQLAAREDLSEARRRLARQLLDRQVEWDRRRAKAAKSKAAKESQKPTAHPSPSEKATLG